MLPATFPTSSLCWTKRRERADDAKDSQEDIQDSSEFPPRRVWDLYSNRVVPSFVLLAHRDSVIPSHVWAVSHSRVLNAERHNVTTRINNYEWPIPVHTTLDHVHIELLNMGAEYIFLDVLCLRQLGDAAHEDIRREEWKVGIPTLMNVY